MHYNNLTIAYILLMAVICVCHAVFYTKSSDVDYPRIGRRSFYTTGKGKNYPRIGRRSDDALSETPPSSMFSVDGDMLAGGMPDKRGFYTKNDRFRSYPRVGRAQGGDEEVNSNPEFFDDQSQAAETTNTAAADLRVPLALLFMAYDNNGDGQLSKSEFMSGMTTFRRRNPLC